MKPPRPDKYNCMWNNTSANERLYLSLHGIVQTGESSGSTGVTTTSSSNEVYTNYAECARLSVKSNGQTNVVFFSLASIRIYRHFRMETILYL